ncbi:MAG: exopolyphosphatase [Mycobacterium sp.]|nr:exopolyphosphatase [Mycobacterium sp.]
MSGPLVVANCSGFYGDRLSAMREQLDGGSVDVITGDYLAELTMLILGRQLAKDPSTGYARTFVQQLVECLADALDRGVRIVSNAGGLNPRGLAAAVREVAERLGVKVRVATVSGDDLLPSWDALAGERRLVGGEAPPEDALFAPEVGTTPLTANAYLGSNGIVRALDAGAQVVVTGRVTDASLVVGPAAWHHGWQPSDLDALAGATVAGHLLECGAQVTGGNFSLYGDLLDGPDGSPGMFDKVGFPIAEVAADGSSVITKHPGTGGAVTVTTVTEQLLYECTGGAYGGPDVVSLFDTVQLTQQGPDRVAVSGTRGEPSGPWLKVSTNRIGGYRTSMTVPLTGLDVDRKAELIRRQLAGPLSAAAEATVTLARTDHPDAGTEEEASALLHFTVKDPDPKKVGRAFSGAVVASTLASIPGFSMTSPPGEAQPYGVYAPAWVYREAVTEIVEVEGEVLGRAAWRAPEPPTLSISYESSSPLVPDVPTARVPLGVLAGARSGDKGGSCTLGVYTRTEAAFEWLRAYLTSERLAELLPEASGLDISRESLPNVRAVLFQIPGLLGQGVAAGTRFDPQAKGVGEWLRSRHVDAPISLLDDPESTGPTRR